MTWPQSNLLGISSHLVSYRKVTAKKFQIQKTDNQKYVDAGQTSKSYVQSFKPWQTGHMAHFRHYYGKSIPVTNLKEPKFIQRA